MTLLDHDVLVSIFAYFDRDKRADRLACSSSARVCHAWTEIASAVLWGECSSLMQLYRVLLDNPVRAPALVTEARDTITRKKKYEDPVRWSSFLRCAARIHRLNPAVIDLADWELLKVLISHNSGKTLFPQLRWLSWKAVPRSVNILLSLVSPSIYHLQLTFLALPRALKSAEVEFMMSLLSEAAPSLSTLSLGTLVPEHGTSFLEPILSGTYRNLHDLTLLLSSEDVNLVTPALFARLCSVEHLSSLDMHIRHFAGQKSIHAPYLRKLSCTGPCDDLIALLSHMDAPNLVIIELRVQAIEAVDISTQATAVLRALSARLFASRLHSLTFYVSTASRLQSEFCVRLLDVITPALRLAQLCHVDVSLVSSAPHPQRLIVVHTDKDFEQIARAWPMLERLAVRCTTPDVRWSSPERDVTHTQLPTPQSLRHLAAHCPHLRTLELSTLNYPVSISMFAEAYAVPSEAGSHWQGSALRILSLPRMDAMHAMNDVITKAVALAQFLDALFPWLDIGACFTEVSSYGPVNWRVVGSEVRALRERRLSSRLHQGE